MTYQLKPGTVHRPQMMIVDRNGALLTGGTTFLVAIRRDSDGAYWDFGGGTPQFRTSAWTTRQASLAEADAANDPGWYRYAAGWDTTGLASGLYTFTYSDSGTTAGNLPASDDAQIVDLAITSDVTSSTSTITGAITTATAPLATTTALAAAKTAIDAANTALAAIQGTGFTAGTDDLHSAHALLAGTAKPGDAMDLIATAIKATTFAASALTAAAFATNSITANALASDAVAEIQAGLALDATVAHPNDPMTLANNAITSAKIATNAITANGLASDAVAEIQAGLALGSDVTASTASTASAITAATSPLATSINLAAVKTGVDAANTALTAIEGGSFSGTTDSLHALRAALDSAATASATATSAIATAVGTKASQTSVDAVQADIILIKGPLFDTSSSLGNIGGFVIQIDSDLNLLSNVIGVSNVIGATVAGSTLTAVHTDYTDPSNDNKWKDQTIIIVDPAGANSQGFSRNIVSHASGIFLVDPPLTQLPGVDDPVRILAVTAAATPADVAAAAGGPVTLADGALTASTIGSGFVAAVQAGLSTLDGPAVAAAVWNALRSAYGSTGTFAEQVKLLPDAAAIASAVWAVTDGTMTKGAALDLLRRRVTNKRVLSLLGVLSFFADDGTTVEKTSTVRDVNGVVVTPASGEAAQASAEA